MTNFNRLKTTKDWIAEGRKIQKNIWKRQDLKSMALLSIDTLCTYIEDGMDKDKALESIYKFSHCSTRHLCYSSHKNWRNELKEFYRKEVLKRLEE